MTQRHITKEGRQVARWDEGYPGRQITGALMLLSVLLLGNREILDYNATIGYVFAAALLPLWIMEFRRYRAGNWFAAGAVVCVISGLWLAAFSSQSHDVVASTLLGALALFLGFVFTVMVLLWARRIFPGWVLGLVYGLGMLSSISTGGLAAGNFWKYALATPLTVIGLSLAAGILARSKVAGRMADLLMLAAFAAMALLNDSRSMFGTLLIVAALVGWQVLPRGRSVRNSMVRSFAALGLVIVALYNVGTSMALEGMLGEAAAERSAMQLQMSGSLLLGGRPELMATLSLMANQPMGYGLGVTPQLSDIMVAKEGMASIGYNPDNGYVERFMFGHQFELHSTAADLWVTMGIPGLVFALALGAGCVLWILHAVAARQASALVLFLAVYSLWNLMFSPFYSAVPTLGLAVGLMFSLRSARESNRE